MRLAILLCAFFTLNLSVKAQDKGYKEGYLILKGGRIQDGFIKHSIADWTLFGFKQSKLKFKFSRGGQPIKAKDDVLGFVVESDSFTIKNNIKVHPMAPILKKDYVKVVRTGAINLYHHRSKSTRSTGGGMMITDQYLTELMCNEEECISIYRKKKQSDRILKMISDNQQLVATLKQLPPMDWNISRIVATYNDQKSSY